jgi:3',5'-cyclic AMP phosphodiesterase CpdA
MAPIHVLGGNHDDPALVREHFPLPDVRAGDYRYATDVGGLRLIACDSTVAGGAAGSFGPERLAWLESLLDEDVDRPTIVAMHHPPIVVGIDALDKIRLAASDAAALGESLARRPQVLRLVAGHVHRAVTGAFHGVPIIICASNHLAAPLEVEVGGDPEEVDLVREPPSFVVHALLQDGTLVSHVQPVLAP